MPARLLALCALAACTTRGPVGLAQRELRALGTRSFEGQFEEVFDAAYLSLEQQWGRVATASRLEGVIEGAKLEVTAPAGFDGTAYRSYAVSVYQEGAKVAVTAVPRLWSNERDVSDEPWWVLAGESGEEQRWDRLFDGIEALLQAWREVPELSVERSRGEVATLGITLSIPADYRGLELAADRRTALAQATQTGARGCPGCPGGLNPTFVFEVQRRRPAFDAPRLYEAALEAALGPKVAQPEAWEVSETAAGSSAVGQVVASEPARTVALVWHLWDAGEPVWMFRAAAACGAPEGPAGCELQWQAMVNGVRTAARR